MRFILDTNIIIPLEDSSKILEAPLSHFIKSAALSGHTLMYHPATVRDIQRDLNQIRKEISLSRLNKYIQLEGHSNNKDDIDHLFGYSNTDNDACDNEILYALYCNCADFLISEDIGIHRKAKRFGISDRVLYIQQARNLFGIDAKSDNITFPGISNKFLSEIDPNNNFFDSLRSSYSGFNHWFEKSQRSGRKAWIISDESNIGAIIIYKEEESPIVTDDSKGLKGKSLKLCTFKVGELCQGRKFGELLLKKSFNYAFEGNYDWIYLTIREDSQLHLIELLGNFGFETFGKCLQLNGEYDLVLAKPMKPVTAELYDTLDFTKKYYPWFTIKQNTQAYVVPIQPRYHLQLFPEIQVQPSLFENSITAGNAINQAYLSNSKIKSINSGDVLLFYRSGDTKGITSIGIIEKCERTRDSKIVIQLTRKRTIYSENDIDKICEKDTLVILFKVICHFEAAISSKSLADIGIIGAIQTIRRISRIHLEHILKEYRVKNYFHSN